MMSVVQSEMGQESPPPRPRAPRSQVEMYQPPDQIGGGWGGEEATASRERMQRRLDRAKSANAKGRGMESHPPVVVHVPLPDLSQPVISGASPVMSSGFQEVTAEAAAQQSCERI